MERNKNPSRAAIACILALAVAAPAFARTITVSNTAPADFRTIQAAIDDANDGDINGDCRVDFPDRAIMASHWLRMLTMFDLAAIFEPAPEVERDGPKALRMRLGRTLCPLPRM